MRTPTRRLVRALFAALVLAPVLAWADNGLQASFSGRVVVDELATLNISLRGTCCPAPPNCQGSLYWRGLVHWGNASGASSIWEDRFPDKPQGSAPDRPLLVPDIEASRSWIYPRPGRYLVIVSFEWWALACGTVQTIADSFVVDIEARPEQLANGWLGTAFDPQATVCAQPLYPGMPVYVVAGLAGLSSSGITGAEFRLTQSWITSPNFTFIEEVMPGWIKFGNALEGGTTIATSTCHAGPTVPLLKVTAFPPTEGAYTNLYIERHLNPSNPNYSTPMFILCDAPVYTAIPTVEGYTALLSRVSTTAPCPSTTISVEERAWGQVKALYR